jgi:hypothetical protein
VCIRLRGVGEICGRVLRNVLMIQIILHGIIQHDRSIDSITPTGI